MFAMHLRAIPLAVVVAIAISPSVPGQAPAPTGSASQAAAPRGTGTVKAVTPHDFVLTTATGQDLAVTVPEKTRIVLVPPGSKDLSAGQPGTIADIAAGDRVIVNGTAGDAVPALNATRIIVIKSGAIAARNAADQAAWARGAGGIVRSVDASAGAITVASGARTLTVNTTANTVVRRYSGASVRFEDAVRSTVAAIQPGDQLRARGTRSPDGLTLTADEIVSGSFANFSGTLTAVDATAGTVTLKDLASRRPVTVSLTNGSNLRRLPPGAMAALAARTQGSGERDGGAPHGAPSAGEAHPADSAPAGEGRAPASGQPRSNGAGLDLSRMLDRLPTQTPVDLKVGDAVMIVASNNPQTNQPTAITLIAGVEQILAAHPGGETTLSPWSLGGGGGESEAGAGEGAAAH